MRAGKMRNRVKLQSKSVARNGYGEEVVTWTDTATVWAAIQPLSGAEYLASSAQQQSVTHRVTMRYRDSVTPSMRVQFTDRTSTARNFDIESVIEPDVGGEQLTLMVREQV